MDTLRPFLEPVAHGVLHWFGLAAYSALVLFLLVARSGFRLRRFFYRRRLLRPLRRLHGFLLAGSLLLLGVSIVLASSVLLDFVGGFLVVFAVQLFISLLIRQKDSA